MLSFWWVRHAPVINNNNCCYGDNEVDCDTSDTKSFNNLVNNLPENAKVYSSTLSRAKKTFQATVKLGYNYKEYFEDGRLKEQNIGEFAGMKYDELYRLTKKGFIFAHYLFLSFVLCLFIFILVSFFSPTVFLLFLFHFGPPTRLVF